MLNQDNVSEYFMSVFTYWWYDAARAQRTAHNMARGLPNYPDRPDHQEDPPEFRYWLDHTTPMPRSR